MLHVQQLINAADESHEIKSIPVLGLNLGLVTHERIHYNFGIEDFDTYVDHMVAF